MRARLFSRVGETKGADFEIGSGATVGRHPRNEIVLEPSLVSSRHARITWDEERGCYVLEDLESLNGTALDGQRVVGRERLGHLHVITFAGKHDFIFQDLERCARRRRPEAGRAEAAAEAPEDLRPEEKTSVERLPVAIPDLLASGSEAPPEEAGRWDKTSVERLPVAIPDLLAGSAVRRSEALEEAGSPEPAPEEAGAWDKTSIERSPVTLPDFLSGGPDRRTADRGTADRRAAEAPETVELDRPPPDEPSPEAEPVPEEVLELMAEGAAAEAVFRLEIVDSETGVERFDLVAGENLVGRGGGAQVRPDSLDISRRHALLTVAGGRVTVRDLGSRNHTYLEGELVDGEVEVAPGARLHFGSVAARLVMVEED